ncbi:MAG: PIN domain-containing protein [Rhizomicrobium sp.]
MIALDTNIAIFAINGRMAHVRTRLEAALLEPSPVGISAVVLYELRYGIERSARPTQNAAALAAFLSLGFDLWPFEPADADEAGDVRASLGKSGAPIGPYDILIAAQARRRGAALVTANASEFARVPGLKTDDWSKV